MRYLRSSLLAALALTLLACCGDPSALIAIGYLPILLAKQLGGDPGAMALLAQPTVLRSVGVLLATTALLALAYSGLPDRPIFVRKGDRGLRRMLDVSVAVAIVVPTGYAITRLAWAIGIPFGIDRQFLDDNRAIMGNGAVLAGGALVGAVLTRGLTRPWGAHFPRWIPVLGGRRVPIGLARNSAVGMGLIVLSAGAYFIRSFITGDLTIAPPRAEQQLAAWLPEVFWPLWGIALIVAALAYSELRRRSVIIRATSPSYDAAQ